MSHHKDEHPDTEGVERTGPVDRGEDVEGTRVGGEGEGFLDKVREFFTGGPESRGSHADVEDRADTDPEPTSGWDGSGEPPELTVPENDAVAAHTETTSPNEGSDAYESRHGNGVDDSGVLADAPPADVETEPAGAAQEAATQEVAGRTGGGDGDASRPGESGPDEVRDGGHGWGSAAPLESGVMPLGHPIKAWHDTMTYVMPDEDGYAGSDPHEWFVDGEAAQRAGFRHAHGG